MLKTPCFTLNFGAPEVLYQALHFKVQTSKPEIILNTNKNKLDIKNTNLNSMCGGLLNKTDNKNSDDVISSSYAKGYDESCDLWSLGVILYAMLCGRVPFSGGGDEEKLSGSGYVFC